MSTFEPIPGPRIGEATVCDSVTKTSAVIPFSVEALEGSRVVGRMIDESFDRWQRPWKYPDRPRWPESFVVAPRLAAFLTAVQERRQRLREAYAVLRGRERLYDPDMDDQW